MIIKYFLKYHLEHFIWLEINSKPTVREYKMATCKIVTIIFESKLIIGFPGEKAKGDSEILALIIFGMIE